MSTIARLSLEKYEVVAEKGIFDPRRPRHIELIRGCSGEEEVRPPAQPEGILRPCSLWPGTP
ncbi:MAG: hypothetical protein ABSG86_00285 [Thermoguttaceae bacterium]|jgi:hypothetical protein